MAFREVTMIEIKEVLRRWIAGSPKKRIAAQLGCDPKTVRRYVDAAVAAGLAVGKETLLTDEVVMGVIARARPRQTKERGDAWKLCDNEREFIKGKLKDRVRLSKIRRLMKRRGVAVSYTTLHRFATSELDFGKRVLTLPVSDGKPGEELQVDTGWMTLSEPDVTGKRRRFRAWIFTPVVSRYRFVYACFKETTETAIDACEAAWEFYGGVFTVLIPDNTKAIIQKADPLSPTINETFLEYSQSRDFSIDAARVRRPKDKARVERSVRDTRDDCFGGEILKNMGDCRRRALTWCRDEYGMRRHTTTGRMPSEHFDNEEKGHLNPMPTTEFDIPVWSTPKVGPDLFCVVEKGFYSLPHGYRGHRLRARADSRTVRFYNRQEVVRVYGRVGPGKQQITPEDYPDEAIRYARRDLEYLSSLAYKHGEQVGGFADKLLGGPLPWTRMRRVRALLGLVKKYGAERVDETCALALAADMDDVRRLKRMLAIATKKPAAPRPEAKIIPIAKYLRDPSQYALPLKGQPKPTGEDK